MANYATLKAAVAAVVKSNGNKDITGTNMQSTLFGIIESIAGGYLFKGVATPSTSPGSPDQNVFYIGGAGTYTNFGSSFTVQEGYIGIFSWNGSWSRERIKITNYVTSLNDTFDSGVYMSPSDASSQYLLFVGEKNIEGVQTPYQLQIQFSSALTMQMQVRYYQNGAWTAFKSVGAMFDRLVSPSDFDTLENGFYRVTTQGYIICHNDEQYRVYYTGGYARTTYRTRTGGTWGAWGVLYNYDIVTQMQASAAYCDFYFNGSNVRSTLKGAGILVPVKLNDVITITADEYETYYATITDEVGTSTVKGRTRIEPYASDTYTITDTSERYLWLYLYSNGSVVVPLSVEINGKPVQEIVDINNADFPRCIVDFDYSNSVFHVYNKIRKWRYVRFDVALDVDNSEIVYKNLWRLTGGQYCSYIPSIDGFVQTTAESNEPIMHNAENEFTMNVQGKADHTGGWHGDERIDTSGSYCYFFLDGVKLNSRMTASFRMRGRKFFYEQYSTLHETSSDGTTPVTGHPVIAHHYKRTEFEDARIDIHNAMIPVSTITFSAYYSGLFCMKKYVGDKVIISGQEYTGASDNVTHYFSDRTARTASYYNNSKRHTASVWSMLLRGGNDEECTKDIAIYDRADAPYDLKYYRFLKPADMSNGQIIETEMVVHYM